MFNLFYLSPNRWWWWQVMQYLAIIRRIRIKCMPHRTGGNISRVSKINIYTTRRLLFVIQHCGTTDFTFKWVIDMIWQFPCFFVAFSLLIKHYVLMILNNEVTLWNLSNLIIIFCYFFTEKLLKVEDLLYHYEHGILTVIPETLTPETPSLDLAAIQAAAPPVQEVQPVQQVQPVTTSTTNTTSTTTFHWTVQWKTANLRCAECPSSWWHNTN